MGIFSDSSAGYFIMPVGRKKEAGLNEVLFVHSHSFLLFLSLGNSYIASLLSFDWKLQPKATQYDILSVFSFLSCVSVNSQSL